MSDEHRHCKICGRTCSVDDETCSTKCQDALDRRARSRRNYMYLLYGTAALLFVLLLSSQSHL
ncbi:MAG TPA: DUF2116 family Zn-ribbon domain-containing protein [Thermoplasmata archaeon]|nr:DUF2116 family Zn-ribbon domain-containing protein [Thermoplasmata archaeon]